MARKCPICGGESLEDRHGEYRFAPPENVPGGAIVIPDAGWEECTACGEQILSLELERALSEERYRRLGLLTPEQIKAVRERTGLSQADIAKLLGVGEKTYTRWESSRSLHNESSDTLIRLIDRNADLFVHLRAERRPDRDRQIAQYVENLGQRTEMAIAAHGGQLDRQAVETLRKRLLEVAASRREG